MTNKKIEGTIISINGSIIKASNMQEAGMLDYVYVGNNQLAGEIIKLTGEIATIQIYEDNTMMKTGEKVISTGLPLSVRLGPGLLSGIFDGVQRPIVKLAEKQGAFFTPGTKTEPLDDEKKWHFVPTISIDEEVFPGKRIGYVEETSQIRHYILYPADKPATSITHIVTEGDYTINDIIATTTNEKPIFMANYWPVRKVRKYRKRLKTDTPLLTGLRVIDTFFPIAKGGTAVVPGGFGTGKTVIQHNLAKWSDADIIVYIGCGERGNEMTDVLEEFPGLIDPRTGDTLMNRTVLIANTSNMSVATREISIYTGITIAEYYRDMGYNVAIMADSTSRWAEALREISGRLEEMPAEEGFPAYLPTRLAEFYERAGSVETFNGEKGSITIIGAVSPPGGDFSEPVTQHTKRFVRCFWALDKELAYSRHYPAISWINSYSEYKSEIFSYLENREKNITITIDKLLTILKKEEQLAQIVKLIGPDSLPDNQKIILLTADILKRGFLQQNSFNDIDRYTTIEKQIKILNAILYFHEHSIKIIDMGTPIIKIKDLDIIYGLNKLCSTVDNEKTEEIDQFIYGMEEKFKNLYKIYQ